MQSRIRCQSESLRLAFWPFSILHLQFAVHPTPAPLSTWPPAGHWHGQKFRTLMDGIGTPHPQPCVQSIWAWLGRWCTILTVAAAEHGQGGRGGPLQSADLKISYRSASPGGCIRLSRLHISNYSPWHTRQLISETCQWVSGTDFCWYFQPVRNRTCSILLPAAGTKHGLWLAHESARLFSFMVYVLYVF